MKPAVVDAGDRDVCTVTTLINPFSLLHFVCLPMIHFLSVAPSRFSLYSVHLHLAEEAKRLGLNSPAGVLDELARDTGPFWEIGLRGEKFSTGGGGEVGVSDSEGEKAQKRGL